MAFPWALARLLPSAVRVRIRSRSTSAKPPRTASINPRHRHHVAGSQLAEQAEKLAAVAVRAGHLLAVDVPGGASGGAKLVKLAVEGLAHGADAGITDEAFFRVSFDHKLSHRISP